MSIRIEEGAYCMECDDCPISLNEGELFDSIHSVISAANAANWLRVQSDSGEWQCLCPDCAMRAAKVSVGLNAEDIRKLTEAWAEIPHGTRGLLRAQAWKESNCQILVPELNRFLLAAIRLAENNR